MLQLRDMAIIDAVLYWLMGMAPALEVFTGISNSQTARPLHQWTRAEFEQLVSIGVFDQQRVELIEGQILDMSPMGSAHATAVKLVDMVLQNAYGKGFFTRCQLPLALGNASEPEPDIAVIRGQIRDFTQEHPRTAVLVVEVSDSTLEFDQEIKASVYARAGIENYWVVNLRDRCLEVYGEIDKDSEAAFGVGYQQHQSLNETESIVVPDLENKQEIAISDVLP